IIKTEIDRLDHLVRDFLAFAKPTPFDPKPVAVEPLLHAVAALIGPESEAAGVATSVEASAELPPVAGDPDRLRQVLLNLTRNALEALQDRGGHVTMRARLVPAADGAGHPTIELDVEDDGPGFSEQLPIFDAFFTTKGHGTGLGLSVVHRIVTDHDGSIRVQSRPGRTCFT